MPDTATEEKTEEPQVEADERAEAPDVGAEEPAGNGVEKAGVETAGAETAAAAPRQETVSGASGPTSGRVVGGGDSQAAAHPIEFLGNIEVEASAELGRAQLTIQEVLGLKPGSVVQLDKMLGDPVELMVRDKLIAKGEVVVVEDRFGVRITEVVARSQV